MPENLHSLDFLGNKQLRHRSYLDQPSFGCLTTFKPSNSYSAMQLNNRTLGIALLSLAWLLVPVYAQFDPFAEDGGMGAEEDTKTQAEMVSEYSSVAPGEVFTVAIKLKHQTGWHAYYQNPGGPGLPLEFDWELPDGVELKQFHWPTPHLYSSDGIQFYVHENDYALLADIQIPSTAKAGESIRVSVTPAWQLCDDKGCDPPMSKTLTMEVKVTEQSVPNKELVGFFKKARSEIPIANTDLDIRLLATDPALVFSITPKDGATLGNVHYIDNQGLTDSEKPQTLSEKDGVYTLNIPRNADSPVGTQISGLLVDRDHKQAAIAFSLPSGVAPADPAHQPSNQASQAASAYGAHGAITEAPSAADLALAAELYDADSKIDFILLDGTKEKSLNFLTALGFIFIGGFLLNLMPCVFPVLGIKVMGFAQQAGSDPRKIKIHGLVFMSGLVVSMWILAGIIYIMIFAFGRDVNWGEQLTSPVFLAAMIMLLYLFGLNMAGVFEIGTSLTGAGGELQAKKGYSGSFFSGVLTTLIATPCSGPFLGSVMGYTLKQPPLLGMVIFTVFALGISVPYVLLAFFPALINKLPRPGAWMITFKQLMAFALFATAAYFYQSFAKITGTGGASWLLMGLVVAGLAVWAYGRFATPVTPKTKKYIWGYAFPLLVAAGAFSLTQSATRERAPAPPLTGSSWYPGVVEFNQSKKRIVWVDHTADW